MDVGGWVSRGQGRAGLEDRGPGRSQGIEVFQTQWSVLHVTTPMLALELHVTRKQPAWQHSNTHVAQTGSLDSGP